jgi:hypothetical protein
VTDLGLEAALRDLADHVAFPDPPDVAAAVRRRIEPASTVGPCGEPGLGGRHARGADHAPPGHHVGRGWRRPIAVAAAVLAVAVAVTASIPRARHAVADRLGLRGVDVRVVPSVSPAATGGSAAPTPTAPAASPSRPDPSELGRATTLADAGRGWDVPLLVPPEVPAGVYVDDATHEVHLTFADGTLLSQFPNAEPVYEKLVDAGVALASVSVAGDRGLWISGPAHVVVRRDVPAPRGPGDERGDEPVDERGDVAELDARLAGNTLVWEHGDVTLRVEGLATLEEALAFAASLRPAS